MNACIRVSRLQGLAVNRVMRSGVSRRAASRSAPMTRKAPIFRAFPLILAARLRYTSVLGITVSGPPNHHPEARGTCHFRLATRSFTQTTVSAS